MNLFKKREESGYINVPCPNCGHIKRMEKHAHSAFCERCMHRMVASNNSEFSQVSDLSVSTSSPKKSDRKPVACPKCRMKNEVPSGALSVFCRKCGDIISIEKQSAQAEELTRKPGSNKTRTVRCYNCFNLQSVPLNAMSSFCSGCGNRIELTDIRIKDKCFDKVVTRGDLHVLSPGILRADADAMNARIDGELFGDVYVEDKLVIGSKGKVLGNITARRMEVEKGAFYRGIVKLNSNNRAYQEEQPEELAKTAKKAGNFES